MLVGKKDGLLFLCVDCQRLNTFSQADAYPMFRIDEMLHRLGTDDTSQQFISLRGIGSEGRSLQDGLHYSIRTVSLHRDAFWTAGMESCEVWRGCAAYMYIDDLIIFSHSWGAAFSAYSADFIGQS